MIPSLNLSDFHRVVAMNTLAGIGMGLVGIFIPLYLLELGSSLSIVIVWLITLHISILLGAFISVSISNRIGLVRCWYIRVVLTMLLFGGLYILPSNPNILFLLTFISGLEAAFFWIPYNILTVRKTDGTNTGSSLAFMSNLGSIIGLALPLVAAFIISVHGYPYLFVIALFFILISLIPVLPLREEKTDFHFSFAKIKETARKNRHFILPEILDNLGQDAGVIWTLFIFITGLTVIDIGILGVISGIVGIVVTHITGSLTDKWNKKRVMRFGAILTTLMWAASYIIAIYSPTPVMLYVITALRGFALGIFTLSYGTIMFNRARTNDAQFLVLREVPTVLGRVIVFSISLILIYLGHFELTFLLVALLSLYFWFNNIQPLVED